MAKAENTGIQSHGTVSGQILHVSTLQSALSSQDKTVEKKVTCTGEDRNRDPFTPDFLLILDQGILKS